MNITNETLFTAGSGERLPFSEVINKIENYVSDDPDNEYRVSIGTDSMTHTSTLFVLAIVVHRVGKGGIFFYKRFQHDYINNLRDKLYAETSLSISATEFLMEKLFEIDEDIDSKIKLSIHLDIGETGPTKDLIKELEGWVTALGYDYAIKPDAYAASSIADRYSK